MSETLNLGNGNWATKDGSLLAYNSENNNFKPLPFDFTRASTATYVDSDGLIKTAGNGEPRIDYKDNTDGALLLEPSRSNIIDYSKGYTGWGVSRGTITENSTASPDGYTTATLYTKTEGGNEGWAHDSFTVSSVGTYTTSVFMKKGNADFAHILLWDVSANGVRVWYDLENGTVGTNTAFGSTFTHQSSSIEDYGNGWYRCIATITVTGSNVGWMLRVHPSGGDGVINTDSGKTFYYWGAQLEQGSYATSYIPTSGSAVTRVEESCNGAGNSEVFNDTEGVIFVETEPFIDGDFESQYISLSDGTSGNDFVTIQHRDSGQLRVYAGGFAGENIQFLVNLDMAQNLKIAVQYKESDYKLFVNGTEHSIYSSGGNQPSLSGLSQLDFNLRGSTNQKWKAKTKQVKIYNTTLSDAELQALTS